jgi:hypothetical protein
MTRLLDMAIIDASEVRREFYRHHLPSFLFLRDIKLEYIAYEEAVDKQCKPIALGARIDRI